MASSTVINEDDEVELEHPYFFRIYKNGRILPLFSTTKSPASLDPITGVESKDITIDPITGVSARLYLPPITAGKKIPVLIYFHGGGFFLGNPSYALFHNHLNIISSSAPLIAVSIDYRLAPEHPLPAAYEDSWAALRWVFTQADPWLANHADKNHVFLAGDSAGANIAHHMALRARDSPVSGVTIKGIALIHPYFYDSKAMSSVDPGFHILVSKIWRLVSPSTTGLDDPLINPMATGAPDIARLGCELVLVAVAGKDELMNVGKAYYEKLKQSGWGGTTELVESPDGVHDFHLFDPDSDQAKELINILRRTHM